MSKKKQILLIVSVIMCGFMVTAQNSYSFSAGLSIPDNISNKYLKTGLIFNYGVDIKLYKGLYLNTILSVSYNNKNPDYRFGFDDEPALDNLGSKIKEIYYESISRGVGELDMYLFNTSLALNLKYRFWENKILSPYIHVGINGNLSFYKDYLYTFYFDNEGSFPASGLSSNSDPMFHVAYGTAVGINYKIVFLELEYKLMPSIKFGAFKEQIALFVLNVGVDLPFKK